MKNRDDNNGAPDNRMESLGPNVAVFAFYGISTGMENIKLAFERTVKWFEAVGRQPDRAGILGSGYPDRSIRFKTAIDKLRKTGFNSVDAIEIGDTIPKGSFIFDYWLKVEIARHEGVSVIAVDTSILSLDSLSRSPVVSDFLEVLRPGYVIGYEKDRKFGPALYAMGLAHGLEYTGPEYERSLDIARWGDIGIKQQVFNAGLLRDVYAVNLLNSSQLSAKVDSTTLGEWIRNDPTHGNLTHAAAELLRWDVPLVNVEDIRKTLWEAGVIFDRRKYIRW